MTETEFFKGLQVYVGREYRVGLYDCAHLAADVQREMCGREINLPTHHPMGTAGQRRLIQGLRDELAERIDVPFPSCAAILVEGDHVHIGTVALRNGEPWILHNSHKLGSAHLHRLKDLERWGMKLEGFYKWR